VGQREPALELLDLEGTGGVVGGQAIDHEVATFGQVHDLDVAPISAALRRDAFRDCEET
jgi:hypothetical protein